MWLEEWAATGRGRRRPRPALLVTVEPLNSPHLPRLHPLKYSKAGICFKQFFFKKERA